MKTRADFIRDLKKPGASLKKLIDYGKTWEQVLADDPDMLLNRTRRLHDHMNCFRAVSKVQSNSVAISGSWLDFPNAKQMDYDGKIIKIYGVGHRELNIIETNALAEWNAITETEKYKADAYYDAMTDYSGTFYQEKSFWNSKGLPYMFGVDEHGGKYKVDHYFSNGIRYDGIFIRDNSLRGELIFSYEIKFD